MWRILSVGLRCRGVVGLGAVVALGLIGGQTVHVVARGSGGRGGWHGALVGQGGIDGQWLRVRHLSSPLVRTALVGHPHETRCAGRRCGEGVGTVETGSGARLAAHWRLGHVSGHWGLQSVVVNRGLGARRRALRAGRRAFQASLLRLLHHHGRSGLIGGVVKETTDIVHEERIQEICDLLLIGEFQSTLERNPER